MYDEDYVPVSKPVRKPLIRQNQKNETAKKTKAVNKKSSGADLVAKEKWEKECEEIFNYKLIVEHVDHDY